MASHNINPEQWFVEQLRAYTQRQPRGERTTECPDDAFLRSYAARPGSLSLLVSRVRHVASCNHCLPALLDLRSAKTTAPSLRMRAAAIATLCAACLVVDSLVHSTGIANGPVQSQARMPFSKHLPSSSEHSISPTSARFATPGAQPATSAERCAPSCIYHLNCYGRGEKDKVRCHARSAYGQARRLFPPHRT